MLSRRILRLIKYNAMGVYGGVEVWLTTFLTSTLNRSD